MRQFASGSAASVYYAPQFERLSRNKLLLMAAMGLCAFQGRPGDVRRMSMKVLTNAAASVYCFMHGEEQPDGTFLVEDLNIDDLERKIVV
jgi:hypothetical protein